MPSGVVCRAGLFSLVVLTFPPPATAMPVAVGVCVVHDELGLARALVARLLGASPLLQFHLTPKAACSKLSQRRRRLWIRPRLQGTTIDFQDGDGVFRRRFLRGLRVLTVRGQDLDQLVVALEALVVEERLRRSLEIPSVASPVVPRAGSPSPSQAGDREAPTALFPPTAARVRQLSRSSPPVALSKAWSAAGSIFMRGRSGGAVGLELGVRIGWRWLLVELNGQLPTAWELAGRSITVRGVSGALGVGWRGHNGPLGWCLAVGVVAEWLSLRRVDQPATAHGYGDFGAQAGINLTFRLVSDLHLGLTLRGLVFPLARTIAIPEGPRSTFNQWGVRVGGFIAWALDG